MSKIGGTTTKTHALEQSLDELTDQVRLYNHFGRRFIMGLVVGVGTALGATIVAALIILLFKPIFTAIGLGDILPERSVPNLIQEQH